MNRDMEIELAFGKDGLALTLPDTWPVTVIAKPEMPVLADPAEAMAQALAAPHGCPPLAEIVRGRASACILISPRSPVTRNPPSSGSTAPSPGTTASTRWKGSSPTLRPSTT